MTEIGITGGWNNTHMIYVDGKKYEKIKETELVPYLDSLIREKVAIKEQIKNNQWQKFNLSEEHMI